MPTLEAELDMVNQEMIDLLHRHGFTSATIIYENPQGKYRLVSSANEAKTVSMLKLGILVAEGKPQEIR